MTLWMVGGSAVVLALVWWALAQFIRYWVRIERDRTDAPRAPGPHSRRVG